MRPTRIAGVFATGLTIAAAVGVGQFSDATFTSTSSSGPSTITAATDWTPPQLDFSHPGSPVTGPVTLQATATDLEDPAVTIGIDVSPSGADTWAPLCSPSPSPVTCTWETTAHQDGSYDLRATAHDTSGNATIEIITLKVTNHASTPSP